MNNWCDLLKAVGIDIPKTPCGVVETDMYECINGPMTPHSYTQQGVAVFTTDQLEIGMPEDFGFSSPYQVIEGCPKYVMDYKYECSNDIMRPIHRYSRCERF